jgi:hypothetical protein
MTELNTQIEALAAQLNAETSSRKPGTTVSILVKASAAVSLGFDDGEEITVESLKQAIVENFLDVVELSQTDCVDTVELMQVRSE